MAWRDSESLGSKAVERVVSQILIWDSPRNQKAITTADMVCRFFKGMLSLVHIIRYRKSNCPTAKKYAQVGNILLSVRAPVGALNIADQKYGIGRGLCAIQTNADRLERDYTRYLLEVVRTELNVVATGSTYDAVSVDEVSNMTCVQPTLEEQRAIANFLDCKTTEIDHFITNKRKAH